MADGATSLRGRSLAIVVATDPDRGDLDRAVELARAARRREVEVGLFFMHRAVRGLPAREHDLRALADDGCDLVACATSAERFDIPEDDLEPPLGSQDDHAALVHRADRVVAFT